MISRSGTAWLTLALVYSTAYKGLVESRKVVPTSSSKVSQCRAG